MMIPQLQQMRVKIFQKRQIQIRAFQVHQQKKSLEKMKDFLENKRNKKTESKLSKEQKVGTTEEPKFQEKVLERMKHKDNMFIKTVYGLQPYNKTWHTWHKQCQEHLSWCHKPWPRAHLSHQFQWHHGKIFPVFLWLQDLFLQWHHHLISIILAGRQTTMEIIHQVKQACAQSNFLKMFSFLPSFYSERCAEDKVASKNDLSGKTHHHKED